MSSNRDIIRYWLAAGWTETLLYGVFVCMWTMAMHQGRTQGHKHDSQSNVLMYFSSLMLILATLHVALTLMRMIEAFASPPTDALVYYDTLNSWSCVLKNTVYATQEIVGSAAAVYRAWVLWNRNWRVVLVPCLCLLGSTASGYGTCTIFGLTNGVSTVFISRLNSWIKAFYALAVIQNVMTTGLMAYRIYASHRQVAEYQTSSANVMKVMRIFVESAALQLIAEIFLLILYTANNSAQYIFLEAMTPIVGITFTAITIRIRSHYSRIHATSGGGARAVATIGSLPMRRIGVHVTQDIDHDIDNNSYGKLQGSLGR